MHFSSSPPYLHPLPSFLLIAPLCCAVALRKLAEARRAQQEPHAKRDIIQDYYNYGSKVMPHYGEWNGTARARHHGTTQPHLSPLKRALFNPPSLPSPPLLPNPHALPSRIPLLDRFTRRYRATVACPTAAPIASSCARPSSTLSKASKCCTAAFPPHCSAPPLPSRPRARCARPPSERSPRNSLPYLIMLRARCACSRWSSSSTPRLAYASLYMRPLPSFSPPPLRLSISPCDGRMRNGGGEGGGKSSAYRSKHKCEEGCLPLFRESRTAPQAGAVHVLARCGLRG